MKIIGFSTGSIFTWNKSINKQIEILKEVKVNAIEICFATDQDLNEKISDENIEYINSLDYVSIHAPFFDQNKNDLLYNKEIFEKIKNLNFKIDCIVLHPNLIENISIPKFFNFCIENMPFNRKFDFFNFMSKHKNLKIVLDTSHALSYNLDYLNKIKSEFKNKIQHIHFSDRRFSESKNRTSCHQNLISCQDLSKFNLLKDINCPIIIETSIKENINDIEFLKKELECVKNFFDTQNIHT